MDNINLIEEYFCRSSVCPVKGKLINIRYNKEKDQQCGNCNFCGRITWIPKEKNTDKRPASHRNLVIESGIDYCEWCLIKKTNLPNGQTLEADHINWYKDGGSADMINILILCTACHKLRHHIQKWHRPNNQ